MIIITKTDVRNKLEKTWDKMDKIHLEVMLDMDESESYLKFLSKIATGINDKITGNYPKAIIDENKLVDSILDNKDLSYFTEDFFPMPVYISATGEKGDSIAILVDEQGNFIEQFEGNEEASGATIKLVNNIMNPQGKLKWVWGSHSQKVIDRIKATRKLPQNLFVSPSEEYASSYWGEDRILFKALVNTNYLSQESEYDWRVAEEAPIEKLKVDGELIEASLTEMPEWEDSHKDLGDTDLGKKYKPLLSPDYYELVSETEKNDIQYLKFKRKGDDTFVLNLVKDKKFVGEFLWYLKNGIAKIESIALHKSLRGKGIALSIYSDLVNEYGALKSDYTLTGESGEKGSFHLWERLSKVFPYSYIHNINEKGKTALVKIDGIKREHMGNEQQQFIVSKKPLKIEDVRGKMKKLKEMPARMNQQSRPLVADWAPSKWMREFKWGQEIIGNIKENSIIVGQGPMGMKAFGVMNKEQTGLSCMAKIIQITVHGAEGPEAKVPKFFEIATEPEDRGQGLAFALHEWAIEKFGGVASDNSLFETKPGANDGMVGLWTKKLPQKYNCYLCNDSGTIISTFKGGELDDNDETILVALKYEAALNESLSYKIKKKFLEAPHVDAPNESGAFDMGLEKIEPKTKENLVSWLRQIFSGETVKSRYNLDDTELVLDTPEKKLEFWQTLQSDFSFKGYLNKWFGMTLDELYGEISDLFK